MDLSNTIISDAATFRDGKKKFREISKDGYTSKIFPNTGVEFEYLIIRLFELSGLNICYPISEKIQQIDGVIYLNQIPFLVDSKFYKTDNMAIELYCLGLKIYTAYEEMTMNVRSSIKESGKHKITIPTLQSAIKILSRSDKFRLVQFILCELAEEESSSLLENGREYPIWSPYNAHDAAGILLKELERNRVCEK